MGDRDIKGDERFYLRCTDPRQEGAVPPPAQRFDLTPIASGKFETLWDSVVADPQSTFLATQRDSNGNDSSTLYRLTKEERPVTTQTIASLCGGFAPYIWSPKKLKSLGDTLQNTFVSAMIATADGGAYMWDIETKDFEMLGLKSDYQYFKQHREIYKQKIGREVDEWFWSGGAYCYIDEAKSQLVSLVGAVVAGVSHFFSSTKPQLSQAEYCHALVQDMGSGAQEFERQLIQMGRAVAGRYIEGDVSTLSFSYCPWQSEDALASYSDSERGIYFYLDLLAGPIFVSSSGEDRRHIFNAVIAHEVGHHRYHREAGLSASFSVSAAMAYGVPETVVGVLEETWFDRQLPMECRANFLTAFREKRDLPSTASSWHAPTVTEVVAMLYETDQIMKEGVPPAFEDDSTQALIEITSVLTKYYKAFPMAAWELSQLRSLLVLDPRLGPAAKELGFSMLADIIRRLPDDAILDFPINCNASVDQAGLSAERRAQLPPDWCDFPGFVKRVRKNTHR